MNLNSSRSRLCVTVIPGVRGVEGARTLLQPVEDELRPARRPPVDSPLAIWLYETALSYGINKVQFICLWDGRSDGGPGGTAHMYWEVNRRTGQVIWIDTRIL